MSEIVDVIIIVWLVSALVGSSIDLYSKKVLYLRDLMFSVVFGPFNLLSVLIQLDLTIIDFRRRDK